MLHDVQAFEFLFCRDTEPHGLFDDVKHQQTEAERPDERASRAKQLDSELTEATAVEQPRVCVSDFQDGFRIEETTGNRAPQAVHRMDADGADGIVDADAVERHHAERHKNTRNAHSSFPMQ